VERYTLSSVAGLELPAALARPRFNIARGQDAPALVARDGVREVSAMRWGLLSPWRGHGGKRPPMIYTASADAIDGTPLLRNAFHAQRCLVLADGFFAWRRAGKKPQPYWIHPAAPGPIAFAGLWAVHRDDDRPSFAIVTSPAGPALAQFSADAPVIAGDAWLGSPENARGALAAGATATASWRIDAVSTWVNDEAHDDPRCIAPLGNPAQGELF
jgi:putative SOS response-associated peptidase YedK